MSDGFSPSGTEPKQTLQEPLFPVVWCSGQSVPAKSLNLQVKSRVKWPGHNLRPSGRAGRSFPQRSPARLLTRKLIFNPTFNLRIQGRSQRGRDRRLQPFAGGGSGLAATRINNRTIKPYDLKSFRIRTPLPQDSANSGNKLKLPDEPKTKSRVKPHKTMRIQSNKTCQSGSAAAAKHISICALETFSSANGAGSSSRPK